MKAVKVFSIFSVFIPLMVVMLENSGKPLSQEQLTQWKALPDGREGFRQMREIMTEEQNNVFQKMFIRRS